MNELNHETVLRQYLLGYLEDEVSLGRIETRLMTDDQFADEVGLAESQLIENYLDGDLNDQDRTRFDRHFLASPQRRSELRLTRDLRKFSAAAEKTIPHEAKRSPAGWFLLPSFQWLRFAALAVAVLIVGFGVWRFAIFESDADKGLAQLQLAYHGQRTTESRTSANLDYAPFVETRGGPPVADERARSRAERYLLDATENATDTRAHHGLGLYYLAAQDLDKALSELNLASRLAPKNAAVHSDIGATYFEKAKRADFEGNPGEVMQNLALGLESTNRALEIEPTLRPALFDRALILQKMSLPQQTREAWERYLEIDATSQWADEARRNLDLLKNETSRTIDKSAVLKDFLAAHAKRDDERAWKIASQTKELVTGVMLSIQLARAVSSGDETTVPNAADALRAFSYLGELEKQKNGDPFFAELAEFYAKSDSARRQRLFQAHERLLEAHELILKADFTKALVASDVAVAAFSSAGSMWEAGIADHQAAYCLTQLDKIVESNERLRRLSEFSRSRGHRWLEGFTEIWLVNNLSLLGEHSQALAHAQKSLEIVSKIGDTFNLLRVYNHMSREYWLIGDGPRALGAVRLTLSQPDPYFLTARQRARNLLWGTEACFRFGYNAAAAAFSREAFHLANQQIKDKWMSYVVQTQLAVIHGDAARYPQAFEAIEKSFEMANLLDDPVMQERMNTQSRLIAASLQRRSGDCGAAAQNYNWIISNYKETNSSLDRYQAYKGQVLCLIEQKQSELVDREMPGLFEVFEENRHAISAEADRNTFFDNEQGVYDIATDYAYSQPGRSDQAFDYSENSRARSLLSSIRNDAEGVGAPHSLAEIRERMPADVQIIYFAVLDDRILAWHISKSKVFTVAQDIGMEELDGKIRSYLEMLTARKDVRTDAADLYRLLISPFTRSLESDKTICIVADKSLLRLPFASLISPDTSKYLIEEYPLLYSPSASVFIKETEIGAQKGAASVESLISIGNPTFSRSDYSDLADLPGAAREAAQIKALYASASLLLGGEASKQRIIDQLAQSTVVHFAGHYVPNTKFPGRSKFLLSSDTLMLDEIPLDAVKNVRLVLLSACETGIGPVYKGEGMIGASRAFLAMGVPLVVASQWAVDSEATAQLMIDFHTRRAREKLSTAAALQKSQVEMLTGENTRFRAPFYWASFMPIGGYTNY